MALVFFFFVLTVFIIQTYNLLSLFTSPPKEPFIEDPYDFLIRPETYDSLEVSDAMTFKEKPLSIIKKLLGSQYRTENHHTREGVQLIVQRQLGEGYQVKYWRENPTYFDIIIHSPPSWVGILIVIPKTNKWEPHVIGYIMEDKLSDISGYN
jgi:hypothetical protein